MKLYNVTLGGKSIGNFYIIGIPYFLHSTGKLLGKSEILESRLMEGQWNRPLMIKPRRKR